jgi:ferredoxin
VTERLEADMGFTVHVDRETCIGAGTCEALAPELFAVTGSGPAEVLASEPDEELRPAAEAAEASCPMAAIALAGRS